MIVRHQDPGLPPRASRRRCSGPAGAASSRRAPRRTAPAAAARPLRCPRARRRSRRRPRRAPAWGSAGRARSPSPCLGELVAALEHVGVRDLLVGDVDLEGDAVIRDQRAQLLQEVGAELPRDASARSRRAPSPAAWRRRAPCAAGRRRRRGARAGRGYRKSSRSAAVGGGPPCTNRAMAARSPSAAWS